MAEIKWTTYIEPIRHTLTEVTFEPLPSAGSVWGGVI